MSEITQFLQSNVDFLKSMGRKCSIGGFILKHGRQFDPPGKLPHNMRHHKGRSKECFRNAAVAAGPWQVSQAGVAQETERINMTIKEAEELGYEVVAASQFEVGLVKKGMGLRTWFCQDFDRKLPSLDHPEIQRAIAINEQMEKEYGELK